MKQKLILFFILIVTSINVTKAQPPGPKEYPPTGWGGDHWVIEEEPFVEEGSNYTFSTVNNTNCTLSFDFWFYLESENEEPILRNFPVTILPYQSGGITVGQLFNIWNLTGQWRITRTALWLHIDGMTDWMALLASQNGVQQQVSGVDPPCNCFIPTFTFTSTGATLQIDPCP